MNREKILALLVTKFPGVRKDGLQQLAGALALQVADETEATAQIEKLTPEKVTEFVTDWRKEVDKEVSSANKTHEKNLKTKYEFVEKKETPPTPPTGGQGQGGDEPPAWAKALLEQNQKLNDRLAAFETGKTTETRLSQLEGKFKDKNVPDSIKSQIINGFKRMNFGSEEEFTGYLTEIETGIAATIQELSDKGLQGVKPPAGGNGKTTAVDAFISRMDEINKTDVKP